MFNHFILLRLLAFQEDLKRKANDNGFTVNETRFICERASLLIKNYSSRGSTPLKEKALSELESAIENADLYYSSYNSTTRTGKIPHTHVVKPAIDAISAFLAKVR